MRRTKRTARRDCTGKEDDSEVGLTYFGARFYVASIGRWASADPLTVHAAASDPNPYAYVLGSPMRFLPRQDTQVGRTTEIGMQIRSLILIGASISLAAGCVHGNYRVVKKINAGGEVALEGPQEEARQKADGYMHGACPSGFDVIEEGEAVVGQNSASQTKTAPGWLGPQSNTQSTTTDKREWRIKYQCKGAATDPSAPAAAKQGKIQELVIRF